MTAMCLQHSGSQRMDRHRGSRGMGALWEMSSLWPFPTHQAIVPHAFSSLKLPQRGLFPLPISLCLDHRLAATETNHPIGRLLTRATQLQPDTLQPTAEHTKSHAESCISVHLTNNNAVTISLSLKRNFSVVLLQPGGKTGSEGTSNVTVTHLALWAKRATGDVPGFRDYTPALMVCDDVPAKF